MGRAEYFDPVSQSRKPIKSGSIVNNTGLEYTPEDVKEIDDKIDILKGAGVAKEKVDKTEFESHKAENMQLKEVHGLRVETGVFTPILGTSNIDGSHSYYENLGRYVKINNIVHIDIFLILTGKDSNMNGDIRIKGLPFASGINSITSSFSIGQLSNVVLPTNGKNLIFSMTRSTSHLVARVFRDNAEQIMLTDAAIKANSGFAISGSYITD